MNIKGISIIICTYSRATYLSMVLDSINKQKRDNISFEVILVIKQNDQFFPSFENKYNFPLKIVFQLSNGLSRARNIGVLRARYSILVFIDDDTIPIGKYWIHTLYVAFTKNNLLVMTGKVLVKRINSNFSNYRFLFTHYNPGNKAKFLPFQSFAPGAHFIIKKSLFKKIGGFRTDLGRYQNILLSGEDDELSNYLGTCNIRVFYEPELKVKHMILLERLTMLFLLKRLFWQGYTDIIVAHISKTTKNTYTKNKIISYIWKDKNPLFHMILYLFYSIGRIIGYLVSICFYRKKRPFSIYENI